MNVSKLQPDALNYQVTIDIAAADYAEPLRKRLNEYRRKADIKGFRRGMAPMSLIRRMYGDGGQNWRTFSCQTDEGFMENMRALNIQLAEVNAANQRVAVCSLPDL